MRRIKPCLIYSWKETWFGSSIEILESKSEYSTTSQTRLYKILSFHFCRVQDRGFCQSLFDWSIDKPARSFLPISSIISSLESWYLIRPFSNFMKSNATARHQWNISNPDGYFSPDSLIPHLSTKLDYGTNIKVEEQQLEHKSALSK